VEDAVEEPKKRPSAIKDKEVTAKPDLDDVVKAWSDD
jgi:hypothetical protein